MEAEPHKSGTPDGSGDGTDSRVMSGKKEQYTAVVVVAVGADGDGANEDEGRRSRVPSKGGCSVAASSSPCRCGSDSPAFGGGAHSVGRDKGRTPTRAVSLSAEENCVGGACVGGRVHCWCVTRYFCSPFLRHRMAAFNAWTFAYCRRCMAASNP